MGRRQNSGVPLMQGWCREARCKNEFRRLALALLRICSFKKEGNWKVIAEVVQNFTYVLHNIVAVMCQVPTYI